MSPRSRAYLMLLAVAAIWGFAAPVIKFTFAFLDPVTFLTYRFFLTCVLLVPLLLATQPKTLRTLALFSRSDWGMLVICGLLGSTLQLGLLFWGLELTSSLDGSIINSTAPILVSLAGFYFLGEHISRREKLGHLIAFFGTLIIIAQPLLQGGKLLSGSMAGNLLVLAGTLAWVGYVLLTKRELRHRLSPLFLTTNMFFWGLLSMLPIYLFRNYQTPFAFLSAPLSAHLGVLYMVIFSGSLAYWLYQKAQKTIEVSEANLFLYLPPVFTAPVAFLWLGEPLTFPLLLGSTVIALGVMVSETKRVF